MEIPATKIWFYSTWINSCRKRRGKKKREEEVGVGRCWVTFLKSLSLDVIWGWVYLLAQLETAEVYTVQPCQPVESRRWQKTVREPEIYTTPKIWDCAEWRRFVAFGFEWLGVGGWGHHISFIGDESCERCCVCVDQGRAAKKGKPLVALNRPTNRQQGSFGYGKLKIAADFPRRGF